MTLHSHETFGPVVSLYTYRDVDDAVTQANATAYGLNASVWSRDGARGRAVAARVHAGTVNVNEAFAAAWGSVDAPMGGMGDSGSAAATGPTASSSTPSPRPSPTSASRASPRRRASASRPGPPF